MTKIREFPALFMTMLVVGASLTTASCLRQMAQEQMAHEREQTLPSSFGSSREIPYDELAPEFRLALKTAHPELTTND